MSLFVSCGLPASAYPTFDITVTLLNEVVEVLALSDSDIFLFRFIGIERGQSGSIGATFIESHHFRFSVILDELAQHGGS